MSFRDTTMLYFQFIFEYILDMYLTIFQLYFRKENRGIRKIRLAVNERARR